MNAKEFLKSKGLENITINGLQFSNLLDEYHTIATTGQKIDLDRSFENLTEKYEKERKATSIPTKEWWDSNVDAQAYIEKEAQKKEKNQ